MRGVVGVRARGPDPGVLILLFVLTLRDVRRGVLRPPLPRLTEREETVRVRGKEGGEVTPGVVGASVEGDVTSGFSPSSDSFHWR